MAIIDEIFENFEVKLAEQEKIKVDFDESQFDVIKLAAPGYETDEPTQYLSDTLIVTANEEDVLEEKKFPFGHTLPDIVEEAHPETVVVADGPLDSGVVENQNEQQRKIIDMVNKMPTGNLFHTFANEVKDLIAIANDLDQAGLHKEAAELDSIVQELFETSKKKS